MIHDLLTQEERLRGLKNARLKSLLKPPQSGSCYPPVPRPFYPTRPLLLGEALNTQASRAAWNHALDERRGKLFAAAVVLLAAGITGAAWLFSLLGWIR
ncbi:MAG: hypothetical protein M1541_04555 [Acidobacteria bacterium]|nr:hypothetical protein [Acidobacteriota bacterium]